MEIFKTEEEAKESRGREGTETPEYPCPHCGRKLFEVLDDRGIDNETNS